VEVLASDGLEVEDALERVGDGRRDEHGDRQQPQRDVDHGRDVEEAHRRARRQRAPQDGLAAEAQAHTEAADREPQQERPHLVLGQQDVLSILQKQRHVSFKKCQTCVHTSDLIHRDRNAKNEETTAYADFVELRATERREVAAGGDALVERVLRRPAAGGLRVFDVRGQFEVGLPDPRRQHRVLLAQRRLGPEHAEVANPARGAVAGGLDQAAAVVEHPEAPTTAGEGPLAPCATAPPRSVHAQHRHAAAERDLPAEGPLHRRRPPVAPDIERPAHCHLPRVLGRGRADVRRLLPRGRGRRIGCHFCSQVMIEARAEVPVELRAAAPIYARRRHYVNMTGAFTCTGRRHRVRTWTKPGQGQAIAVQVVGRWGGDGLLLAMPFCSKGRSQWPSHEMWNPLAVICSYLSES
jgi:hypothetical protein